MNIAFLVAHLNGGGSERTVVYLSKKMAELGHNVSIISLTNERFYSIDEKVRWISLNIPKNSGSVVGNAFNYFRRIYCLNKFLRQIDIDILFPILSDTCKYLVGKRKYKLILSERNNPLILNKKQLKRRIKFFNMADGVVYQTDSVMQIYKKYLKHAKGVVIQNAVGNEDAYVFRHDIRDNANKVIATGRIHEQKDYLTLINAFNIVHQSIDNSSLDIYGNGDSARPEIDKLIKKHNLENVVHIYPAQRNIIEIVNQADCYVLSSKYEGMPNSLMEAMAIGMPCVSTNCPFGPNEIVKDGINGYLVNVGDYLMMAERIIHILTNKNDSMKLSINSRKILTSNSIDNITKKFVDYFYNVMNEK